MRRQVAGRSWEPAAGPTRGSGSGPGGVIAPQLLRHAEDVAARLMPGARRRCATADDAADDSRTMPREVADVPVRGPATMPCAAASRLR